MKQNILKLTFVALMAAFALNTAFAQQPHVYINPGHGGYDSDDRNMVIYPWSQGDSAGSWESKSNLRKGLALVEILEKKGYKTSISRVTNTTADDLNLSTIVALCNASGADVFYSIHSNATGTSARSNFPMGIYRGYTGQPVVPNSDVLTADLGEYLIANTTTVWTSNRYAIYGDWTFYPQWGTQGLGVLRGNKAVSMLDEGSFHDYIPEAYRLLSLYYCWLEAWNFSLGADKYFGRLDNYGLGIVAGNIRDDRIKRLQECAQDFIIYGDDELMPIHNATVRLLDSSGNEVQRCKTDTLRNGIYLFKYVTPGYYTVEVTEPSHFTQTKPVMVTANAPTYQNFYIKRVRDTPPVVVNYSPVWNEGDPAVKCSTDIELEFNWDMDSATTCDAFTLDPPLRGKFKWTDSYYRLIFTPEDAFGVNTLYTLTLKRTAEHAGGTQMDEDFVMKFRTQGRNHLTELAVFPYENAPVHYKTPTVELRVDSMLDTYNLFNRLRVLDSQGNELDWNKRGIKYNKTGDPYGFIRIPLVKDIEPGKNYKLILDWDIADTAGIHLVEPRVINFKGVDAGEEKPGTELIDDFETASGYLDFIDADDQTTTFKSVTDKLFGSKALQVTYDFGSGQWLMMIDAHANNTIFAHGDMLGVHVYGDMGCNEMYARFMRSDGNVFDVPMGKIDFHGWRYMSVALNQLPQDLTAYMQGFFFKRGSDVMGKTGTIRFDNLIKGEGTGLAGDVNGDGEVNIADVNAAIDDILSGRFEASADVNGDGEINIADVNAIIDIILGGGNKMDVAGVKVTCGGDYVVASADTYVQGIELIGGNGQRLLAGGGNVLNVSSIEPGVYIVRVIVNDTPVPCRVVIGK